MGGAATPDDERARLAELRSLALLDTEAEERFDRVTRLAQRLFDVPIALVSLVDEDRQWFKSKAGLDVAQTPRESSFCAHAILDDDVMHVPDATVDARFETNPLVLGNPNIRFYAGCPIAGPSGAKLGTLCIIGREPRDLTDADARSLRDLAEMVEREIAATYLAIGDELTGLSNRRGFELLGSKVLYVCQRRKLAATVLYLDIDRFKAINDRHGHAEGDRALQRLARVLERTLRASDVIARLGGDEFAAILTGTADASEAPARVRQALADSGAAIELPYALEVSIGTATQPPGEIRMLDELLVVADEAMYRDKLARRGA